MSDITLDKSLRGYVYVLGNMYMPGIYKIGMTKRSPHSRAEELSTSTAAPFPFDVLYYALTRDARSIEKWVHEYFAAGRVSPNREFFHSDLDEIVDFISTYAVAEWTGGQREVLIPGRWTSHSSFIPEVH